MTDRLSRRGGGPVLRSVVKHPWLSIAAVGTLAALVAGAGVVSGLVPIKASSGHWRITAAILDFAKVRSVKMHARRISEPALDDPALVLRGAGHYETACASCHGSPGMSRSPVMAATTPFPPELGDHISRWKPQELFYIVKHGIKFTGMPGWPAQTRDDEVWAMVAFLRQLPSFDRAAYRSLVYGPSPETEAGSAQTISVALRPGVRMCTRCHGIDGLGREHGAFPKLAGQQPEYLYRSLRAFAEGRRFSGIMSAVAASLDDETMRSAAAYYAGLGPDTTPSVGSTSSRGGVLAAIGIVERDIPACMKCHGPDDTPRNPAYPRLAGQHVAYLKSQLHLLQHRRRGGSGHENVMHVFVGRLSATDIDDLASHYSTAGGRTLRR
jgi:cytochrome c553